MVGLYLGGFAVESDDLNPAGGDADQLILAKLDGLAGVLDERGDIGCDEVLALPHADDQWRVATRRDHGVRYLTVHRYQGECAT